MTSAAGATVEQRKIEEQLVREHLPLVHYAVSEMAAKVPRHVSRDDLVSAGMAGLAQAARSFDPERGISFDRYASTRIRGALLDAITALPERLRQVVIGYFFEERSMQDIAEELGVSESRISQMRAEALVLLKDGMNSQLDPEALPVEAKPSPRVARR